jgi:small subunit ribosomal protein S7
MRKGKSKSRLIVPDPKFSDLMVTKFVNNIMLQGKKNSAFDIFYEAIELVTQRSKEDGLEVWKKALANVKSGREGSSRLA